MAANTRGLAPVVVGVLVGVLVLLGWREWRSDSAHSALSDAEQVWCAAHTVEVFLAGDSLGLIPIAVVPPSNDDFFDQGAQIFDPSVSAAEGRDATGLVTAWDWWLVRGFVELGEFTLPEAGVGTQLPGREFQDNNMSVARAAIRARRGFSEWVIGETTYDNPTWAEVFATPSVRQACSAAFGAR